MRACPAERYGGCFSAITQKKGELTDAESKMILEQRIAWGCDLCQSVCPYNREPIMTPIEFFHRERIGELTRERLDAMDKAEFTRRAFAWRGRRTVERNLDILLDK